MQPFETLELISRRAAEAVIAQSGLSHQGLAQHIRTMLASGDPASGAILQQPVIEGAHPFVEADETFGSIAGSLLNPALVDVLDGSADARPRNYVFRKEWHPFSHQMEAWRHLLQSAEPQSVLVTSGTGSGKTECFLIPILHELIEQAPPNSPPLEGVQAIMLYPLNALIASQKQRFKEWTAPFNGRVRFGLYNGDMPKTSSASERRADPEQVIDREVLRASPPPILVTNPTMLEYMLVRAEDEPILAASQGRLRWIVLDEAHSLVGAAAAEIALLLRRVLLAFGVHARDVHFVATSATIGEGRDVKRQLKTFLAEVAGIPDARVHVVEGHRRKPPRPRGTEPKEPPTALSTLDEHALYDALGGRERVWNLVEALHGGAVSLDSFSSVAQEIGLTPTELALTLSKARARPVNGSPGNVLAPLRIHAFQRAMPGLWSCLNPACAGSPPDWPFGRILTERAEHCLDCRAPVLEIISCSLCGEAILEGEERGNRITGKLTAPPLDEFRDDAERDKAEHLEDDEDNVPDASRLDADLIGHQRLFATKPLRSGRPIWLDRDTWTVVDTPSERTVEFLTDRAEAADPCPCCARRNLGKNPLRPLRFGAPFLLGNTVPILLDGMTPERERNVALPAQGRRLLSFTDSRQGTARLSAKLQIESERNFVRSLIYHTVQDLARPAADAGAKLAEADKQIAHLVAAGAEAPGSALQGILNDLKARRSALAAGSTDGISWPDMVNRLAERVEVKDWIREVWAARDGDFEATIRLSEFLLLREFGRRPSRANSIETLGLARLRYPAIDALTAASLPEPFRRRGKTLRDWQDYLYVLLTHFVRANNAILIEARLKNWLLPRAPLRTLAPPGSEVGGDKQKVNWPDRQRLQTRPALLLRAGLNLDLSDRGDLDDLDECLRKAWDALSDPLRSVKSAAHGHAFEKAFIAPLDQAFWCPVTRRPLDRVAFGISPYSLGRADSVPESAEPVMFPRHPDPMVSPGAHDSTQQVQDWLERDQQISALRRRGCWNNLSDRIALFADYARAAEHSAQQDSSRLRRYEAAFTEGRINILNCSTTMEMGVDIGSVEAVMMSNVPPSIASYRQRVGRAGRRGQPLSLAFTFCKDRPLDREAFRDPCRFLTRKVAAPKVALSSRPIVQRHVNAYLLGAFFRANDGEALAMKAGEFFGCPAAASAPRVAADQRGSGKFAAWLERPQIRAELEQPIRAITERSLLENDRRVLDDALRMLRQVEERFVAEWSGLRQLALDEGSKDAARSAMAVQLRRLCEDFLLGALAERGFLPGHGFPTHVVQFLTDPRRVNNEDSASGGENRFRGRGVGPQRQLDLAIRDYAPGSEVVLDGLVHRSAGVTLNWKRPASEAGVNEIQALLTEWTCRACGAADVVRTHAPESCPACGGADVRRTRYLRPAGFTVDYRADVHADIEQVDYIKPDKPDVSARSGAWIALPDPRLGRYRVSPEGMVFYSSTGAAGHGYAVCLECGRAEAEPKGQNGAKSPALADHRPLRRRRDQKEDRCPGNDRPFSVQHHLALGHEITTDVFELQPSAPISEAAANALAIALREALAQELGIEASEMGYAVKRAGNEFGGAAYSLFIFDRAAGGGGFSTLAESRLRPLLRGARKVLDCATPGCERACSACVLTSDSPDQPHELDRLAALDYLKQHLELPLALPAEERFTAEASPSEFLLDEINNALTEIAGGRLDVWLEEAPDPAQLTGWKLAPQLFEWSYRGRKARLLLPPGSAAKLSSADKLAVRDFVVRNGLELAEGPCPSFPNGAKAICAVSAHDGTLEVWATRDRLSRAAGESWGRPHTLPIARGPVRIAVDARAISLDTLAPPPGAQFKAVSNELDGSIAEFGLRAAKLFIRHLGQANAWPKSPVKALEYTDPFVASPLVARLLIDSCAALVRSSGAEKAELLIVTRPPKVGDGPPRLGVHNWPDGQAQASCISAYAGLTRLPVQIVQREVPHGRYLRITFANGRTAQLVLDQGFGAWRSQGGSALHDFRAPAQKQALAMRSWNVGVVRSGIGSSYVVALAH